LGFIDPNISIAVIKDEKIVRKIKMELPEKVENVIRCKNPRCITVTEHYVRPVFKLVNRSKNQYVCEYCDALYTAGSID
jgi:aspartate carbamoyltransferase regulatory subunit